MAETLSALCFVLALLYALRALMRWRGLGLPQQAATSLRVVGGIALGPRKRLCVVEAGGERLVLGVTDTHISLLRSLPIEAAAEAEATADTAREPRLAKRSRLLASLLLLTLAGCVVASPAWAAAPSDKNGDKAEASTSADSGAGIHISLNAPDAPEELSSALEMLALLTLVSVAPAILLMATCFTRIVVVLALLRQAIGLQHMPPNQVLVGLALFLTLGVMSPVGEQVRVAAYEPYVAEQIDAREAGTRALVPIRAYLAKSTRESDLALFLEFTAQRPETVADVPLTALIPAHLISELRTAFEIGFMVFLPFLVVDLVVSSLLISMGMIVLPPVVVSLPFKLMLFVLADGWNLVLGALVQGLR